MNDTPKLEMRFLLHVQLETRDQPWHATLERVGTEEISPLEFYSPLELARHVAGLQAPDLKPGSKGLK